MDEEPFLGKWESGSVPSEAKKRRCGALTLCALGAIVVILFFVKAIPTITGLSTSASSVSNATLGFGAIVLMSLPERSDRRDFMSLIAYESGIQVTKVIDAVHGEDIHPKARPFGKANSTEKQGYIGSWRTHMDSLRYVVDNRLETALLLEDDVDWDVRVKSQLAALSSGLARSPLRSRTALPVSPSHPYGLDWDIMHLGAVIIQQAPAPYDTLFSTYHDADRSEDPGCWSNDSKNPMFCWAPLLQTLGVPDKTRAILPSYNSVGLPAIAVTLHGAERIIFELSLKRLDYTLDWSIYDLLRQGRVKGWTILPPIFGMWDNTVDSDLFDQTRAQKMPIEGYSAGIERSARQAIVDRLGDADPEPRRWSSEYWQALGVELERPARDGDS